MSKTFEQLVAEVASEKHAAAVKDQAIRGRIDRLILDSPYFLNGLALEHVGINLTTLSWLDEMVCEYWVDGGVVTINTRQSGPVLFKTEDAAAKELARLYLLAREANPPPTKSIWKPMSTHA